MQKRKQAGPGGRRFLSAPASTASERTIKQDALIVRCCDTSGAIEDEHSGLVEKSTRPHRYIFVDSCSDHPISVLHQVQGERCSRAILGLKADATLCFLIRPLCGLAAASQMLHSHTLTPYHEPKKTCYLGKEIWSHSSEPCTQKMLMTARQTITALLRCSCKHHPILLGSWRHALERFPAAAGVIPLSPKLAPCSERCRYRSSGVEAYVAGARHSSPSRLQPNGPEHEIADTMH